MAVGRWLQQTRPAPRQGPHSATTADATMRHFRETGPDAGEGVRYRGGGHLPGLSCRWLVRGHDVFSALSFVSSISMRFNIVLKTRVPCRSPNPSCQQHQLISAAERLVNRAGARPIFRCQTGETGPAILSGLEVWLRKRGWTFKEDRTCFGAEASDLLKLTASRWNARAQ